MSDISPTTTPSAQPTATLPPGYTAPKTASSASSSTNGVNSNTFLQLLVAELQNQNPTSPTDPSQFLSQTAQFQEVQELTSMQTAVGNLVTAQQSSSATSMLGMKVTGSDNGGAPVSGTVTGVHFSANGPILTVGDQSLPYSSVTDVAVPGVSNTSSVGTIPASTGAGAPATGTPASGSSA